jgi:hypothetical protein
VAGMQRRNSSRATKIQKAQRYWKM